MVDSQGVSKGSGFVAFSTPEDASKAVSLNFSLNVFASNNLIGIFCLLTGLPFRFC